MSPIFPFLMRHNLVASAAEDISELASHDLFVGEVVAALPNGGVILPGSENMKDILVEEVLDVAKYKSLNVAEK
jgi:hypothetical protein